MFGTFQPEDEKPNYGITKPVKSYNPVYLNFHEWIDLFRDIRRSKSLREAYAVTFCSPSRLEKVRKSFDLPQQATDPNSGEKAERITEPERAPQGVSWRKLPYRRKGRVGHLHVVFEGQLLVIDEIDDRPDPAYPNR